MQFLQGIPATWPTFCKGPSLTTDTMRTLWSVNWRNERQGLLAFCHPVYVSFLVELREVWWNSWRQRPRIGQADACLPGYLVRCLASVSCSVAEDGSSTFCWFVSVEGAGWAGELSVGKGALKHPFWVIPEQFSPSHWFWDIWIIPQVLNQRTVFVLLSI